MRPSDETRNFWSQASGFPPDKEAPEVYGQEHTDAFEFDRTFEGKYTEDEGREMLTAAGFRVTKTTVYHKGLFRVFRAYRTH